MSLSPKDNTIVEKAVQETLELLEKNAPAEYAKLKADPAKKKALTESARAAATEHVHLAKEFADQPKDIAERLAKHLPESRIKMIQEGLDFPTFRMKIKPCTDGKHLVQMTRQEKPLKPGSRVLAESLDIDWAKWLQYGSIVVEAGVLLMSVTGISVSPSGQVIDSAIDEAVEAIKSSSKLEKALETFSTAWNNAGGSSYQKAEALFFLIKDSYAGGILWTVIKSVCSNMAWYDWLLTVVKVFAMIIAAVATGGAALIAEIALIVLEAVDFACKIVNLNQLEAIKETLLQEEH